MAVDGLPTPAGFTSGMARFGVPLLAGAGGFVVGDAFGAYGFVGEFFGGIEGQLPFTSRIDYIALATTIPYGVGVAIVSFISSQIPGDGMLKSLVFKSARWFLFGVIARLALAGLLPRAVQPSAAFTFPAAVK